MNCNGIYSMTILKQFITLILHFIRKKYLAEAKAAYFCIKSRRMTL